MTALRTACLHLEQAQRQIHWLHRSAIRTLQRTGTCPASRLEFFYDVQAVELRRCGMRLSARAAANDGPAA